ncbi:MAG TPA: hypothetical protein VMW54_12555 [Terriglobia bacterium]|nr:hypothetical protein [Terriglobia bacterium]
MEHRRTSSHSGQDRFRILFCLSFAILLWGIPAPSSLWGRQPQPPDKLTYIKVMKGSLPEYQAISVDVNGVGAYDGRKLDETPRPRPLKLSASTTQRLFGLANSLGDFRSIQLESSRKVANLGLKTFIYTHDGRKNKVQFNYTRNRHAQELIDLFEGIGTVEQHIGSLEFSARYDQLGLPGELTQVEIDLNNNALVDPQLMVPILQKIAGDSEYLHIAQIRAVDILHRIQDPK